MDGGLERPGWGGALAVGVVAVALAVTPNLVNAAIDGDTPVRPGTTIPVGPLRYTPEPGWVEDRAASSYGRRSVVRRGAVTVTVESVPPAAAGQAEQDATSVVRVQDPPAAVAVTVTAPHGIDPATGQAVGRMVASIRPRPSADRSESGARPPGAGSPGPWSPEPRSPERRFPQAPPAWSALP